MQKSTDKHRQLVTKIGEQSDRSYGVYSCANLFAPHNSFLFDKCKNRKILVVYSKMVNQLYGNSIHTYFDHYFAKNDIHFLQIETGESNKNLETVQKICKAANEFKISRDGLFIAIGGGIVLDTVGCAASIYKKSIEYIKISTTLVGQIDVAVGVKAAVNFCGNKNEIGAYKFPYLSINDPLFLKTLDKRELRCGLAEIVKMGIIVNEQLFNNVEKRFRQILSHKFDPEKMNEIDFQIIKDSIVSMAEELAPNLYEKDNRRIVDFGHIFSPQIEMASNYDYKHGEAVAIDMAISSRLAYLMGRITSETFERIINLFLNIGLPIFDNKTCTISNFIDAMEKTSIRKNGKINFVIPAGIGKATFITNMSDLDLSLLQRAIDDMRRRSSNILMAG